MELGQIIKSMVFFKNFFLRKEDSIFVMIPSESAALVNAAASSEKRWEGISREFLYKYKGLIIVLRPLG